MFSSYTSTAPRTVLGFDSQLQTVSIGCSDVFVKAKYRGCVQLIKLANCLHIPTSRNNLISGSRFDSAKPSVGCYYKDGRLILFIDPKKPFASGSCTTPGVMFRLDFEPVTQLVPLANRISENPLLTIAALNTPNKAAEKLRFCTAYLAI